MASKRIFFACENVNLPPFPDPYDSPEENNNEDVAGSIAQLWNLDPLEGMKVQETPEDNVETLLTAVHVSRNSATDSLRSLAHTATAIQCIIRKSKLPSYKCTRHFHDIQKHFGQIATNVSKLAKLKFRQIFGDFCDFEADSFAEESDKPKHDQDQLAQLSRQIYNSQQRISCIMLDRVIADNVSLGYRL